MKVTINDSAAQNAAWGNGGGGVVIRTVEIADTCPKCGGPRGEPKLNRYCDDGEFYYVHNWENPCGHVDKYQDVLLEAKGLAACPS